MWEKFPSGHMVSSCNENKQKNRKEQKIIEKNRKEQKRTEKNKKRTKNNNQIASIDFSWSASKYLYQLAYIYTS